LSFAEVLTLLSIGCVLAALAMVLASKYIRHSKTTEAVGAVSAMAQGAARAYDESDAKQPEGSERHASHAMRHFPPPAKESVPADMQDVRGKRFQSNEADWSVSPWPELHFRMLQAQYYAYTFDSQGTGADAHASALAKGDLDADGHVSSFSLEITADSSLDGKVAKSMVRIDPDE
jgi:hypothetical protein